MSSPIPSDTKIVVHIIPVSRALLRNHAQRAPRPLHAPAALAPAPQPWRGPRTRRPTTALFPDHHLRLACGAPADTEAVVGVGGAVVEEVPGGEVEEVFVGDVGGREGVGVCGAVGGRGAGGGVDAGGEEGEGGALWPGGVGGCEGAGGGGRGEARREGEVVRWGVRCCCCWWGEGGFERGGEEGADSCGWGGGGVG